MQTLPAPSENEVQKMNAVRLVRRLVLIERKRRGKSAGDFDVEALKELQKQFGGDDDDEEEDIYVEQDMEEGGN